MAQRTLGRVLAVVAVTATLTFALPAQADSAPRNKPVSIWEWMSGFLAEKVPAVWGIRQPTGTTKQGGCVDPDGCATNSHSLMAPQKPLCAEWNEQGGCVDPNG